LGDATNNGTDNANPTPTLVAGLSGVIQIDTGGNHTCAVLANGTVACWGDNHEGQLGNATNNFTDGANPAPTVVAGLTGVTQINTGYGHTCALLTNGTVTCWGDNSAGELGNASITVEGEPNPTPGKVAGIP
jgi:alpha-tubulin suppressor-like RCC1 family protein